MAKRSTLENEESVENIGTQEQSSKTSSASLGQINPNIEQEMEEKELTSYDVVSLLIKAYSGDKSNKNAIEFQKKFKKYLNKIVDGSPIAKQYHFLVLFDNLTMLKTDADKIYDAVTKFDKSKPVLMVLFSGGGDPGTAYLIGKLCREYSNGEFVVVVPRRAKSAATLLCCAANEIHMGSLSELGPIDPQINGLPTLGLKNSIEHIAQLVETNPESSGMFAKYLHLSIEPIQIGHYERVAESAAQYAENLLITHPDNLPKEAKAIAHELVYKYKDHGFVIDKSEAIKILGENIVKHNTQEYELGNSIYQFLNLLMTFAGYTNHNFYFIGGLESDPTLLERQK